MPRPVPLIRLARLDGHIPAPLKKWGMDRAASKNLSFSQYIAELLEKERKKAGSQ